MIQLKAILFDLDGTIVDTERDGHRVAFNKAFEKFGLDINWDIQQYHDLLKISGGKERMKFYFDGEGKDLLPNGTTVEDLVKDLHHLKTELFISLISKGQLPLRPGIKRIIKEANENNILVGICTTSNEKAAKSIINSLLRDVKINLILAGDVVTEKKPNPAIYLLALKELKLNRNEILVIEDSENGVIASKNAGLRVLVTVNEYTKHEDLSTADAIINSLGDENENTIVINGNLKLSNRKMVNVNDLIKFINQ